MAIYWKETTLWLLATLFVAGLLVFKLDSLVSGVSNSELGAFARSSNLETILNNPFNAIYSLAHYGLRALDAVSVQSLRLTSAGLALFMTGLMFYVVKHWYSARVATMVSVLFGSSAWLLHNARLATPVILQLSLIMALALGVWLRRTKKKTLAVLLGVLLIVWFLYIPGFVWFVLAAVLWERKLLTRLMQRTPIWGVMMAYAVGVILLAPLVRALILDPQLVRYFFGLPIEQWPNIVDISKNLVSVPKELFLLGPDSPSTWLGRLALLDIFAIAMLVLGSYSLYFRRKQDSTRFIFGGLVIGTLLVGLGVVNIVVLMPLLYVVIAAGLALLLQQWFTVFPQNPLARTLGSLLVIIAVGLTVFYHVNHYFIAWPSATQTKQAFTSKLR